MAFEVDWDQGKGIVLSYHCVSAINQHIIGQKTTVIVASYVSKDLADADTGNVLASAAYTFDGLVPTGEDAVAWAEEQLKASSMPRFAEAKASDQPAAVMAAIALKG